MPWQGAFSGVSAKASSNTVQILLSFVCREMLWSTSNLHDNKFMIYTTYSANSMYSSWLRSCVCRGFCVGFLMVDAKKNAPNRARAWDSGVLGWWRNTDSSFRDISQPKSALFNTDSPEVSNVVVGEKDSPEHVCAIYRGIPLASTWRRLHGFTDRTTMKVNISLGTSRIYRALISP